MTAISELLTDNIGSWTEAVKPKASAGRGDGAEFEVYGVRKLRELIRDLAVRGLLVRSGGDAEPAELLLKSVTEDRIRLVSEGAIKKPKRVPDIEPNEIPFELPVGWSWSRLDSVAPQSLVDGDWIEKKDQDPDGDIRLIQLADVGVNEFKDVSSKYINGETYESLGCTELEVGDILIARLPSPIGRACVFPGVGQRAITAVDVAILRPAGHLVTKYLVHAINSGFFRRQVESYGKGVTRFRISTGNLKTILIPVPNSQDQHRIVAKVDELMALCDKLEAQQADAIEAHKTLVTTILDALTTATEKESFDTAWARIAEHFDMLFTTEWSVDQLENSILQLAVTGRLSRVSDSDEPSTILIQRILTERNRLIEEEKLRTRASDQMASDDRYLLVPDSWSWCRLGNLAKFIDYRGRTPKKTESGVRLITAKNVRFGYIDLNPEEFISETEYVSWMTRGFPRVGDLLFTPEAPLGHVAEIAIKEKFALAQRAICFQLHEPSMSKYLRLVIMSPSFQEQLVDKATGMTATGIKAAKLKEIPIPIPSADEQVRIVAKVDELLAVCDALKSAIRKTQQTQLLLADAITEQAVA